MDPDRQAVNPRDINPDFDASKAAELKRKYLAERDKRLSAPTIGHYRNAVGYLAQYMEDPYAPAAAPRAAVQEDADAIIVGGGFGGLLIATQLVKAGITNIRIIEKGADFGGVWYWNRYPGAACDVDSYCYMPLLEELDHMPSERYARGPEIFDHARKIGDRFALYERALLSTAVDELRWVEQEQRWHVATDRGDALRARFVCLSTGLFQTPRLPGIPGVDSFRGHSFHTARWDYAYTGGSAEGGLDGLRDKRVGIIGTGASAVQAIPHLAAAAKQLFVFQRTPAAVPVRNNGPTDEQWYRDLEPGWQLRRMENFNEIQCGLQPEADLIQDGWSEIFNKVGVEVAGINDQDEQRQLVDFAYMERVRARIEDIVEDSATADALKPWYNIMCKRPCFHDSYLEAFNRPNVTLVDTDGRGVERISENAVWANGEAHEVDCIIFGSGFDFQFEDLVSRNGFEIHGRNGISLTEKWEGGMRTLFGHFNHGFPNLFNQTAAQAGLTGNVPHGHLESARVFAKIIRDCLDKEIGEIEPSVEAEEKWHAHLESFSGARSNYDNQCTPGYYNNEGRPDGMSGVLSFYPGGPAAFIPMVRDWASDGKYDGMTMTHQR